MEPSVASALSALSIPAPLRLFETLFSVRVTLVSHELTNVMSPAKTNALIVTAIRISIRVNARLDGVML
jgi:hypothetical protein